MPMIDVYATAGTFNDKLQLAIDLATTVMTIEAVPNIPMFRQNTAGFVHELPAGDFSNVDGESNYVRVQVLTNAGALDRDKQLAVVSQFTQIIADAAGDPALTRALLEACITACDTCAASCGEHRDHHEHCRICADTCEACGQACRALLAAL